MKESILENLSKKIIKTHLNFGRHIISHYAKRLSFGSVLDIGAGYGQDLLEIKRIKPGTLLYAIENYPPYVEKLSGENIKCFPNNLELDPIPMPDSSVDLIIANQVMEHVKEIFWIFHEMTRVLKKDGYILIGVPNLASLHNRIMLMLGKQPSCIQTHSAHIRGFTKEALEKFSEIGGLELVEVKGSNFYPFPPIIAKVLSTLFPTFSVGIFCLFKKKKEYNNAFLNFPPKNNLSTNFFLG